MSLTVTNDGARLTLRSSRASPPTPRGEITLRRTLAEVALADPNADTAALREMGERVVGACERQERLLEALLTRSRTERVGPRSEHVDLA